MSGIIRPPTSGGGGGGGTPPATLVRNYTAGVSVLDVVYQTGTGAVAPTSAVSIATTPALGIVTQLDVPVVGSCYVQYDGDVMGFSGLTAGAVYMISKVPGQILWESDTGNAGYPTVPGNVVQAIGIAMSPSVLQVAIQDQEEL